MKLLATALFLTLLAVPASAQLPEIGDSVRVELDGAVLVGAPWTTGTSSPLIGVPRGIVLYASQTEGDGNYFRSTYDGVTGWMHSGYVAVVWRDGQHIDSPTRVGIEPPPVIAATPVSIYPNPSLGRVTIEGEGAVYDALGRLVGRYADEQADFRSGIYFLRSDDGRVHRFVVI